MRRSLVAISLFLSAAVTMAVGQEWKHVGDASAVIEAFNEANSKVTSIECSFRQEKYVDVLVEKSVSEGFYGFYAPDSVVIRYLVPEEYSITVSGGVMRFVSAGKTSEKEIASDRRFAQLTEIIRSGGIPSVRQIQDYKIDAYSDGKSYRLVLAPLRRKSGCIEAVIDAGDMSLASFRIMEGGQDYTEFIFTDKQIKVHE